ncbi:hypothetical protein BJ508DRAFT_315656 [Ascobolus immersus RN42]|uniref:Uncharacterized protein n=1 Tax=Ascobolus immersus RN42 TaxID=1160509 RepID=A0A3N4H9U3_ASCIM|nr:hypothetical protein BJ508DRAFT_315656 [Ascobolus immersus RN42]
MQNDDILYFCGARRVWSDHKSFRQSDCMVYRLLTDYHSVRKQFGLIDSEPWIKEAIRECTLCLLRKSGIFYFLSGEVADSLEYRCYTEKTSPSAWLRLLGPDTTFRGHEAWLSFVYRNDCFDFIRRLVSPEASFLGDVCAGRYYTDTNVSLLCQKVTAKAVSKKYQKFYAAYAPVHANHGLLNAIRGIYRQLFPQRSTTLIPEVAEDTKFKSSTLGMATEHYQSQEMQLLSNRLSTMDWFIERGHGVDELRRKLEKVLKDVGMIKKLWLLFNMLS